MIKKIKYFIPERIKRLILSFFYNKNAFYLKKENNVFTKIHDEDFWNSNESKSGGGSTLDSTITIREELPKLISKFSIKSLLDVPCGDYNWMKEIKKDFIYIGGDIVEKMIERNNNLYSDEKTSFRKIDITKDNLPKVDLIFCKDCLQHISDINVKKALNNFKASGSKYILVTSYPLTLRNYDIYDGDYRALNLFIKPFNLSKHILSIREKSRVDGVEKDKTMYLLELNKIPFFKI